MTSSFSTIMRMYIYIYIYTLYNKEKHVNLKMDKLHDVELFMSIKSTSLFATFELYFVMIMNGHYQPWIKVALLFGMCWLRRVLNIYIMNCIKKFWIVFHTESTCRARGLSVEVVQPLAICSVFAYTVVLGLWEEVVSAFSFSYSGQGYWTPALE